MPQRTIDHYLSPLHLAWGGDRHTRKDEILVGLERVSGGNYYNGPGLRDVLLEAFPLPVEKEPRSPLADEPDPFKANLADAVAAADKAANKAWLLAFAENLPRD